MTTQVMITLPDEIYHRAQRLAQLTGRDVADVLADTLFISLQPLGTQTETGMPVSVLSNDELLALADSHMDATQDRRFSQLLYKQQSGTTTPEDHVELTALMQVYQEGLLRKAQALSEAVRRGLREQLDP